MTRTKKTMNAKPKTGFHKMSSPELRRNSKAIQPWIPLEFAKANSGNDSRVCIVIQSNRAWLKAIPGLKKAAKEVALAAGAKNVTIRFAEDDEVQQLNHQFRNKNKPTNVLSFPGEGAYQGDIILARGVVLKQAAAQKKPPLHHTLHLVAHGVLHLLGYDHEHTKEAATMEAKEISLLAQFGIKNPYE
jgi:probable rRNA maturation factor